MFHTWEKSLMCQIVTNVLSVTYLQMSLVYLKVKHFYGLREEQMSDQSYLFSCDDVDK